MPKSQLNETESLDDKIKRIRKKNEEIERRRLEVEADKQTAAKLNALVQLSAPKEDWPPPRSFTIIEEDKERPPNNSHENTRDRSRGNVTFDDSAYEGKKPPPDPAYRFLADDERDPLPSKRSSRYNQSPPTRGQAASRNRGRGNKMNARDHLPPNIRSNPGYEAWREERNRIDEERIRRQRTAQGQWRREWDSQKSENDWQSSLGERSAENNLTQKSLMSSSTKIEPLLKNSLGSQKKSDEETKPGLSFGKNVGKNAASPLLNQAHSTKILSSPNDSRVVQNSGNSLHISFGTDSPSPKVPASAAQRRAGSGRLGPPPPAPAPSRRGASTASGRADGLPQRRARRRIPPSTQRKSSTGDDSWEDADEHSEGEGRAATSSTPAPAPRLKSALKTTVRRTPSGTDQKAQDVGNSVETSTGGAPGGTAAVTAAPSLSHEETLICPCNDDSLLSAEPDDVLASAEGDSSVLAQHSDSLSVTFDENSVLKVGDTADEIDSVVGVNEEEVRDSRGDLQEGYVLENKGYLCLQDTVVESEQQCQIDDLYVGISDSTTNNVNDEVKSKDYVYEQVDGIIVGGGNCTLPAVLNLNIEAPGEKNICVEALETETTLQDNEPRKLEATRTEDENQPNDIAAIRSIKIEDVKDVSINQESETNNNATHGTVSVQNENSQDIGISESQLSENFEGQVDSSLTLSQHIVLTSEQSEDKLQDQITQAVLVNASDHIENFISDQRAESPNICESEFSGEDKNVSTNIDVKSCDNTEILLNQQYDNSSKIDVHAVSDGSICSNILESNEPQIKCTQENAQDSPNTN